MRHLFKNWNGLENRFSKGPIALFLDYDGTLAPIASSPDKAALPAETKKVLTNLIESANCKVAIISGRALNDLKELVGIQGIIYSGNHGLEIEGPKIRFTSPLSLRHKKTLRDIKDELKTKLSGIKGILLEDKGLSLSIHYRLVNREQIPQVKTILHEATILYAVRNKIKIQFGKKVFEIRPALEWDKGKVVLWLLGRWQFAFNEKNIMPLYLGDDVTDEDAFKALENKGVTIFVGKPKKSYARYYLKDTLEVKDFLKRLQKLLQKREGYVRHH